MRGVSTVDETVRNEQRAGMPEPGLVVIFSGQAPLLRAIAVPPAGVLLGRDDSGALPLPDPRLSRVHLRARLQDGTILVEDMDSRNGSHVDGVALPPRSPRAVQKVVRMGHTVLISTPDVRPFGAGIRSDSDLVAGPGLHLALTLLAEAAAAGSDALVLGESGTGKEHAARHFHAACGGKGPLVPVNCATIPAGVAERLLFGARRGAFSGATADAEGYFEAAEGGVLFLDELGELELAVQAKLLRALQEREIMPLGASRPQPVRVRVCAATNRDLRAMVARGEFREDLWHRLAEHAIQLPPLRERLEEIPTLVGRFIRESNISTGKLGLHATFVEAACLRAWPGNVRELRAAARKAAAAAARRGSELVGAEDLEAQAGRAAASEDDAPAAPTPAPPSEPPARARPVRQNPSKEELLAALAACNQNVSLTARSMGVSRTQFYRWMERLGIPTGNEED